MVSRIYVFSTVNFLSTSYFPTWDDNKAGINIIEDILIPLIAIALAELGDKTQISILLLSSKTKKHLQLLFGVIIAFIIVDGIAVLAGSWITTIIPTNILKIISSAIFIFFGLLMLFKSENEEEKKTYDKNIFLAGFTLIMLTEWGDKTQIAAALFSINYNPIMVLIGTILALSMLSIIAIYFGKIISKRINEKLITKISGIAFIIFGLFFLI
jgi:putative Ca2+/H+ antiporter (TMEM165/GDT1 family)